MSQKKSTKEELFLIALAEEPHTDDLIDTLPLLKRLAFSERQANHTINLLAGLNFLVKRGEGMVKITPHGRRVAEGMKESLSQ